MAKQRTAKKASGHLWLSWLLLVIAYITYGGLLLSLKASTLGWALSVAFAVAVSGATTVFWPQFRRCILFGFQSDVGYFVMALLVASLAVAAVSQFRLTASLVLLVAASLLARVDMLVANLSNGTALLSMISLSLLGLGLSWVPHVLRGATNPPLG